MSGSAFLSISDEVAAAIAADRAVVALESSLIAQGLPSPHNLETVRGLGRDPRRRGQAPSRQ